MYKKVILYLLLYINVTVAFAQEIEWVKKINIGGLFESIHDVKLLVDDQNNKIYAGNFENVFSIDGDTLYQSDSRGVFIIKFNENDQLIWSRFYDEQVFLAIILDIQNNIVLASIQISDVRTNSIKISKLSKLGDIIWQNEYSALEFNPFNDLLLNVNSFNEISFTYNKSVTIRDENNSIVSSLGDIYSQTVIDAKGDSLRTYSGIKEYYVDIYNHLGEYSFTLTKYELDTIYTYTSIHDDLLGNRYVLGIVFGYTDENIYQTNYYNTFLTKYNSEGEKEWTKIFNENTLMDHYSMKIKSDSKGNLFLFGVIRSGDYMFDNHVLNVNKPYNGFYLKLDEVGEIIFVKLIEDQANHYDFIVDMQVDDNENYYFLVRYLNADDATQFKNILTKYNASHEQEWVLQASGDSYFFEIKLVNDILYASGFVIGENNFTFGDYTIHYEESNIAVLTKINVDYITADFNEKSIFDDIKIYPNPFEDQVKVILPNFSGDEILSIKDISGKEVYKTQLQHHYSEHTIIHLSAGVYIVYITSKDKQKTIKLIKTK